MPPQFEHIQKPPVTVPKPVQRIAAELRGAAALVVACLKGRICIIESDCLSFSFASS